MNSGTLGITPVSFQKFAKQNLRYRHDKGLYFFAQFNDAITTVKSKVNKNVITVAILDGVLYIESDNKICQLVRKEKNHNIMSALVLREFLYAL